MLSSSSRQITVGGLRRCSEIAKLRQRYAYLTTSSSSKDGVDNRGPTRPNDVSSFSSSEQKRKLFPKSSTPSANRGGGGHNDRSQDMMAEFFASSPVKISSSPFASLKKSSETRESLLDGFRSKTQNDNKEQNQGGRLSRFSRANGNGSSTKPRNFKESGLKLPSSKETFFPNKSATERKSENGNGSLKLSNFTRMSDTGTSTSSSGAGTSLEKEGTTLTKSDSSSNPRDVSKLRSLFAKKSPGEKVAVKSSTTTTTSQVAADSNATLTEIIDAMRIAKEQEKPKNNSYDNEDPSLQPKWRMTGSGRKRKVDNAANHEAIRESFNRLEQRVLQQQGKSVQKRSSSSRKVQIPSREINLVEVSQIFRVSTRELRKVLRSMGELPRGKLDDEQIMVVPETLEYIALDMGVDFERTDNSIQSDEEKLLQRRATAEQAMDTYDSFPPRPPVVCIMGHVDHGKTTLMDALRRRAANADSGNADKKKKAKKSKNKGKAPKTRNENDVAGTEAGGITQVISAFQVPLPDVEIGAVTFLDTPGHAAFRAMRQSGSDAADVIVLVVAADDGVSPQTVEIINFYKSIVRGSGGGISMVVALNKIDKPGIEINSARTMVESQLLEHGIVPEGLGSESEFGPPVQVIPVSGLTGEGLDELITGLVLQSEIMDLRADTQAGAEGVVMDARIEKGLGVVADCIIRWGSVSKGDVIVSGEQTGKVRILRDADDKMIKQGLPSQPVRIVGFEELPQAGDPFICMETEEAADEVVERRRAARETEAIVNADNTKSKSQAELQSAGKHLMSYEWREKLTNKHGIEHDEGAPIRIPVILRADAHGSLMALKESLVSLGEDSSHNVVIDPIQAGIGPALPADVDMALESQAVIICFNVKNDAAQHPGIESVRVLRGDVIYSILDDAKEYFGTYLPSIEKETSHGKGKVGAIFNIGGLATQVAGLQVVEGSLYHEKVPKTKSGKGGRIIPLYRVFRDGKLVESTANGLPSTSLKHFKEDVTEIGRGKECGLSLEGFSEFEVGDEVECWSVSTEYQSL